MIYLFFIHVYLFFSLACSTTSTKTSKHLSSNLNHKKTIGNSHIGVDSTGDVVIRQEEDLDHSLRSLVWHNEELEGNVKFEAFKIKDCKIMLNDPRLGGGEFITNLPEIDDYTHDEWKDQAIQINSDGKLKNIKQISYKKRLDHEQDKNHSLKKTMTMLQKIRSKCEQQLGYARVKYGLPAKKYQASGYFDSHGDWIEIHKAEKNLDDAFKIKAFLNSRKSIR